MTAAAKRKIAIFLLLSAVLLAVLGASLSSLELKPGLPQPYLGEGKFHFLEGANQPAVEYNSNDFMVKVLLILVGIYFIWILFRAAAGTNWRQLGITSLRFIVIFLVSAGLLAIAFDLLPKSPPLGVEAAVPLPPPEIVTAPLGAPPAFLTWLVGAVVAIGAALLGVWFYLSRRVPASAALLLGQEAEKARQALLTGMSLREVILQCYREMSRVLQEEQEIERQPFMTTGDFERLLAAQGFPIDPVHRLTLLFDAVRYGRWEPGLNDDQQAIACLDEIVKYSHAYQPAGSRE